MLLLLAEILASHDPMEKPPQLSIVAMADRWVVFEPCGLDMSKKKLTAPAALTRTAFGTDVDVTVWMAPLRIGVAMVVNVLPLSVPRSTVRLGNGTPSR